MSKNNFRKILDEHEIWTMDDIPDGDFKEEAKKLQVTCYRIQIAYKWFFLATLCTYFIPLGLGQRDMLFGTANCFEGSGRYWMMISQTLLLCESSVMIPVADLLFVGGCVSLVIQLKITNHVITNMDYESTEPKTIVEKYCKLLKYTGQDSFAKLNLTFQVRRHNEGRILPFSLSTVLCWNGSLLRNFVPASIHVFRRFWEDSLLLHVGMSLHLGTNAAISLLQLVTIRIYTRNLPIPQIQQNDDSTTFRPTM